MGPSKVEWYSRSEEKSETPLTINLTEFENGVIIIISEKGLKLGTIAIGIPTITMKDRVSTSSMPLIFGVRNDLLTRAIAERVAQRTKKIVIASTHLSSESSELVERVLKLVEKTTQEYFSREAS